MTSIILRSGWWLNCWKRFAAPGPKHLDGTGVIGYIVQGSDANWRIEGRMDEFDSPTLAADALVEQLTGHPA